MIGSSATVGPAKLVLLTVVRKLLLDSSVRLSPSVTYVTSTDSPEFGPTISLSAPPTYCVPIELGVRRINNGSGAPTSVAVIVSTKFSSSVTVAGIVSEYVC